MDSELVIALLSLALIVVVFWVLFRTRPRVPR